MKLPPILLTLLACTLLLPAGCKSPKPEPTPTPRTSSAEPGRPAASLRSVSRTRRGNRAIESQPGDFDYYLLNLSWSPEFCATHPENAQCAARPGFIVHGLWPQNNDGTYPQDCGGMAKPPNPAAYIDLMPTVSLIIHEWQTHGTCTGLNPDGYFSKIRTAVRSVEIPPLFAASKDPPNSIAPHVLLDQFRRVNPTFPPNSFALSCGNNYFTAIEVCFDKDLRPEGCEGVRSCRANVIKIAPR
ncbi:MAG TPA: ribonuclease T2 [Acidobacteriaceae bacterium]|jgi:ribonuclease T2|nr:ribonuclease T2 [Acidobacteriaceae bacterium]